MNTEERQSLYRLISQFWPHAKLLKDAAMRTAWGKVLEKFPADAVKERVLELAATSKYPPDLADITAALTPVTLTLKQQSLGATVPLPSGVHKMPTPADLAQTQKLREAVEEMGGHCPVFHKAVFEDGEHGTCGEILCRHVPQDCPPDCRRLACWDGCPDKDKFTLQRKEVRREQPSNIDMVHGIQGQR